MMNRSARRLGSCPDIRRVFSPAQGAGCSKGAAVGHLAGHPWWEEGAGCIIGHLLGQLFFGQKLARSPLMRQ